MDALRDALAADVFDDVDGSAAALAADSRGEAEELELDAGPTADALEALAAATTPLVSQIVDSEATRSAADASGDAPAAFWGTLRSSRDCGTGVVVRVLLTVLRRAQSSRDGLAHVVAGSGSRKDGDAWRCGLFAARAYLAMVQVPGARSHNALHEVALVQCAGVINATAGAVAAAARTATRSGGQPTRGAVAGLAASADAARGALRWCSLVLYGDAHAAMTAALASTLVATAPLRRRVAEARDAASSARAALLEAVHPRHGSPLAVARRAFRSLKPLVDGSHPALTGASDSVAAAAAALATDTVLAALDCRAPWVSGRLRLETMPADTDAAAAAVASSSSPSSSADAADDAAEEEGEEDDDESAASWHGLDVSRTPIAAVSARVPAAVAFAQHVVASAADTAPARRRAAVAAAAILPALPHLQRRALAAFLRRLSRCASARRRASAVDAVAAVLSARPSDGRCPVGLASWTAWDDAPSPCPAEAAAAARIQAAVAASAEEDDDSDDDDSDDDDAAAGAPSPDRRPTLVVPTPGTAATGRRRSRGARRAHSVSSPGTALGALTPGTGGRASLGGATAASVSGEALAATAATLAATLGSAWTAAVLADVVVRRCSDKSPAVRTRALVAGAGLLGPSCPAADAAVAGTGVPVRHVVVAALQSAARTMARQAAAAAAEEAGASAKAARLVSSVTDASFLLAGGEEGCEDDPAPLSPLLPLLLRRMEDAKPAVRKAAVTMLGAVAVSGGFCAAGRSDAEGDEDEEDEPAGGASAAGRAGRRKASKRKARTDDDDESEDEEEDDDDEGPAAGSATTPGPSSSSSVPVEGPLRGCRWADLGGLATGIATGASGRMQPPSSAVGVYALQAVAAACADESTSVRRAALDAIGAVRRAEPSTAAVQQLWLACAPPMASDAEVSVAKAAVAAVVDGLLGPLAAVPSGQRDAPSADAPCWGLLAALATHPDLVVCVRQCVAAAAAARLVDLVPLARSVWRNGCPIPGASPAAPGPSEDALDRCAGAWCLLDAIAWAVPSLSTPAAASSSSSSSAPAKGGAKAAGSSKSLVRAGVTDQGVAAAWADVDQLLADAQAGTGAFARSDSDTSGRASVVARLTGTAATVLEVLAQVSGSLVLADGAGKGRTFRVRADEAAGGADSRLRETARRAGAACGALVDGCLRFAWPSSLVTAAVRAAGMLARTAVLPGVAGSAARRASCRDGAFVTVAEEDVDAAAAQLWSPRLLRACADGLQAYIVRGTGGGAALPRDPRLLEEAVVRRLFLAGQVCLWGLDVNSNESSGKPRAGRKADRRAAEESAAGIVVPPTLVDAIQAVAAPALPSVASSSSSSPGADSSAAANPPSVRAHAFAALGKACLRLPSVAKATVAAFVRELGASGGETAPAIRNNALFALSDLCVRYTALVDSHLPAIAAACSDDHPAVRRHAVLLLSQLVQRDFIKWRPVLFHRLAAAMADSVPAVRAAASEALTGPLNAKDPHLLPGMLAEAVVVLSGCTEHPDLNREGRAAALVDPAGSAAALAAGPALSEQSWRSRFPRGDPRGLALLGPGARRRRLDVFRRLIAAMSEEARLKAVSRLVTDLVGAAADGTVRVPVPSELAGAAAARASAAMATPGGAGSHAQAASCLPDGENAPAGVEALVGEALELLCSEECRFGAAAAASSASAAGSAQAGKGDEAEAEAAAAAAATTAQAVAAATRKALAGVGRRFVLETGVPAAIGLRSELGRAKSPVAPMVLRWLCAVADHYGADAVREALANDPRLAEEVAFDVGQAAKRRARSEGKRRESAARARKEAVLGMVEAAEGAGRRRSSLGAGGAAPPGPVSTPRAAASSSSSSSGSLLALGHGVTPRPIASALKAAKPAHSPGGDPLAGATPASAVKLAKGAAAATSSSGGGPCLLLAAAALAGASDSDSDDETAARRTLAMTSPDAKPLVPRRWAVNAERLGGKTSEELGAKPAKRTRTTGAGGL